MRTASFRAARLALAAVLAVFCWQWLTVHYNYRGNWTGLFCIRPGMPVPEFLKSEHLYIFENSSGYDGMVYHLIAHDPWMRKGSPAAIAGAPFRYQRILVPALAWLLAFGQDRWIHPAYFTVILGFVFLGVYWLSLISSQLGFAPAWGLLFVFTPAALTSVDRMTVDVALAAFAVGFALYVRTSKQWPVLLILTCAALTRETALPIVAAYTIFLLTRKQFRNAAFAAATVIPAAAWFVYLSHREPSQLDRYLSTIPLAGFVERVIHPTIYALPHFENASAQAFDLIALAGVAIALALAFRLAMRKTWNAESAVIYAVAAAAIFLGSRAVWDDAYAFGRVLTPFLLLTAIETAPAHPVLAILPILCVDARLALNFITQVQGVLDGLTGSV